MTLTGKVAGTGSTCMVTHKSANLGMARVSDGVDEVARLHAPHTAGAAGHIDICPTGSGPHVSSRFDTVIHRVDRKRGQAVP